MGELELTSTLLHCWRLKRHALNYVCLTHTSFKQSGFEGTVAEINRLVTEAKKAAGIGHDTLLDSLVGGDVIRL